MNILLEGIHLIGYFFKYGKSFGLLLLLKSPTFEKRTLTPQISLTLNPRHA